MTYTTSDATLRGLDHDLLHAEGRHGRERVGTGARQASPADAILALASLTNYAHDLDPKDPLH